MHFRDKEDIQLYSSVKLNSPSFFEEVSPGKRPSGEKALSGVFHSTGLIICNHMLERT